MHNKTILITGGAGFVGSNLVEKLLRQKCLVIIYDNFFAGKRKNLPDDNPDLCIIEGDITNFEQLSKVIVEHQPAIIYHLAAIHYIPYCNENRVDTLHVNITGMETVLEASKKTKLEAFIFASTSGVYRINNNANLETDHPDPFDIYGTTKYCGEFLLKLFHAANAVPCRSTRLFNIYGPKETNDHILPAILNQRSQSTTIKLGNLEPKRDYIYVADVVDALIALAEDAISDETPKYDVYNVGTGEEFSVSDLVDTIANVTGQSIIIEQDPDRARKTDRPHLLSDNSKLRQAVNWSPNYSFREGLELLIKTEYSHLICK